MVPKPTYEELEQQVAELEKEALERKRIDEGFRENELRFTISQQIGRIGSWDRNLKTDEVYWSDQIYRIRGYTPQEVTPSYELVMSQIHPDDLQTYLKVRDAAYYQNEPYNQEYRLIRKDGEIRIVSVIGKVEWDETGEPIRYFGTTQDITERKQTEEAQRESEERFRNLIEGSIQGILIHRNYKPLFVNQTYAAMHGYTLEEILSMDSIVPLISSQDRARLVEYKNDRLTGEEVPVDYEYQGVHKDGSRIWLENKVRVVYWNGQPAIQTTIFDIRKRKQAEEELRESEERYRILIDAAGQSGQAIILHQDKDGLEAACIFCNETASEITGYSKEEFSNLSWIDILHPKHRDEALQRYRRRFEGEVIQDVFEVSIITKSGKEVPVEISSTLSEYQGERALISFFRDITDRKQAEEAQRESEERFRNLIEGSIQGILIHRNYKPLFVNQTYADMHGYTREEILRMESAEQLISHQDQARLLEYENARLREKNAPTDYEYQGIRKDGALAWLENRARVVRWAGQLAIQSTVFNISGRKQVEEALRESDANLKALMENTSDYILISDKDGFPVVFNSAYASIMQEAFGMDMKPGIKPHKLLQDKEAVAFWDALHNRVLNGEKFRIEYTHKFNEANKRHFELSFNPIKSNGHVLGFSEVTRDITERKNMEEMLQKTNKELEQRVGQRTADLNTANEVLEVQKGNLEEVNTALRVLLKKRDQDKTELEEKIIYNVKELVFPYLGKLDNTALDDTQRALLDIMESNLSDITSSFSLNLSGSHVGLTPSEIEVANLIREGQSTKQIAAFLKLSSLTIGTYRKKIRKKLGLDNKKVNLSIYLQSIQ